MLVNYLLLHLVEYFLYYTNDGRSIKYQIYKPIVLNFISSSYLDFSTLCVSCRQNYYSVVRPSSWLSCDIFPNLLESVFLLGAHFYFAFQFPNLIRHILVTLMSHLLSAVNIITSVCFIIFKWFKEHLFRGLNERFCLSFSPVQIFIQMTAHLPCVWKMGISWDSTLCSFIQINDVSEEHAAFIFMEVKSDFTNMKKRAVLTQTVSHWGL